MKAVILGASTAVVAIIGMAAPAGATANGGFYIGGNSASSSSSYSRIGIKDGKFIFEFESVSCRQSNSAMGGGFSVGNAQLQVPQASLPAANANCNPTDTVNNPPANSTVTINGLCDEEAAKAKTNITGNNVSVIVNSTGPCEEDAAPTTPIEVIVTPNAPEPKEVTTASSTKTTTDTPASVDALPQTGGESALVAGIASILAGATYAGTMIVRSLRNRA